MDGGLSANQTNAIRRRFLNFTEGESGLGMLYYRPLTVDCDCRQRHGSWNKRGHTTSLRRRMGRPATESFCNPPGTDRFDRVCHQAIRLKAIRDRYQDYNTRQILKNRDNSAWWIALFFDCGELEQLEPTTLPLQTYGTQLGQKKTASQDRTVMNAGPESVFGQA